MSFLEKYTAALEATLPGLVDGSIAIGTAELESDSTRGLACFRQRGGPGILYPSGTVAAERPRSRRCTACGRRRAGSVAGGGHHHAQLLRRRPGSVRGQLRGLRVDDPRRHRQRSLADVFGPPRARDCPGQGFLFTDHAGRQARQQLGSQRVKKTRAACHAPWT